MYAGLQELRLGRALLPGLRRAARLPPPPHPQQPACPCRPPSLAPPPSCDHRARYPRSRIGGTRLPARVVRFGARADRTVLPQPDGPTSATNSPAPTASDTSRSAAVGPKHLETPTMAMPDTRAPALAQRPPYSCGVTAMLPFSEDLVSAGEAGSAARRRRAPRAGRRANVPIHRLAEPPAPYRPRSFPQCVDLCSRRLSVIDGPIRCRVVPPRVAEISPSSRFPAWGR